MRIAIGTRFFEEKDPTRVSVVTEFVTRASSCMSRVFVAVNTSKDQSDAVRHVNALGIPGARAFAVEPWGKFVAPLNAIVAGACAEGATHLLLASAEVKVTLAIITALQSEMTDMTLVVGAAVIGHELGNGKVVGTGTTVPWNTLALWNLTYLQITGFPLIGDALFDPRQAGVEEMCTIALLQKIRPRLQAILLQVPGVEWDTAHWDPERLAKHQAKMASKRERPEAQLAYALLPPPRIIHIK